MAESKPGSEHIRTAVLLVILAVIAVVAGVRFWGGGGITGGGVLELLLPPQALRTRAKPARRRRPESVEVVGDKPVESSRRVRWVVDRFPWPC